MGLVFCDGHRPFYAAGIHGVTLPCAAAVIERLLEAGSRMLLNRAETEKFKYNQYTI